jgi:hypothetical protein
LARESIGREACDGDVLRKRAEIRGIARRGCPFFRFPGASASDGKGPSPYGNIPLDTDGRGLAILPPFREAGSLTTE